MMKQIIDCTFRAVRNQQYEPAYLFQSIPVVGPILSVPTALFSGTMIIVKIVQAVFQKIKDGTPFFRSIDDPSWRMSPMKDAIDLSIIFVNNVINIGTLGILNNLMVWHVLSHIRCGGED